MTDQANDCPLCCEPFSEADKRYPMVCKTATCSFDYCVNCLDRLYKSSMEGYSEASDGSNQVKIHLQCPVCRASYATEFQKAYQVVSAVIRLRQAALLNTEERDSNRTASELVLRNEFIQSTSFSDLMEYVGVLQRYYDSLEDKGPYFVSTKDCEAWEPFLKHERSVPESKKPSLQRDQTLFYALEDFLTDDEQEFITALMTSGKPELLSQAAFLIHTVMSSNGRRLIRESSSAQIEHRQKVRKRFPLPRHMPRCVSIPMYDPLDRKAPLKFSANNADVTLELANVRGPAARVGLQRGDVVTEVQGETVNSYGELVVALQQQENLEEIMLTVNSTPEIADELRERADKMIEAKVRFL